MQRIINSLFSSITYILPVGTNKECWLVDCGDMETIIEEGWKVNSVLLTHVHFDHIYGLNRLLNHFPNATIYTNDFGIVSLVNPINNLSAFHEGCSQFVLKSINNVCVLHDNEFIKLSDEMDVKVIFTPGHDPSCMSFIINNNIFTGDAYIPGLKVFTKFPNSDKNLANHSYSLLKRLESKGMIVCPGHIVV